MLYLTLSASSGLGKNRHPYTKRLQRVNKYKHKNLGYNRVSTPSILTPWFTRISVNT